MSIRYELAGVAALSYSGMVLQFATTPLLARALGVDIFGLYSGALAIWTMLIVIVDFGLNANGSRRIAIAKNDEGRCEVAAEILACKFMTGSVVAATLLVYTWRSASHEQLLLTIVWASWPILIGAVINTSWYLQGLGKSIQSTWPQLVIKVLSAAAIFALVKSPDDVLIAALIPSLVLPLTGILNYFQARALGMRLRRVLGKNVAKTLASGMPLASSQITIQLYTSALLTVAITKLVPESASNLAAADKVIKLYFLLIAPATIILMPHLSRLMHESRSRAATAFVGILKLHIFGAIAFGITLVILASPIVTFLYGSDYKQASTYICWLAGLPLVSAVSHCYGTHGLVANGRNSLFLIATVAGAGVGVSLIGVLIENFGAPGYVVTAYVVELVVAAVSVRLYRQHFLVPK